MTISAIQPFVDYQDSGIEWLGEFPAHWKVERLKDTVLGCSNGVWGDEPDGKNDIVCIRVADFDRNRGRIDSREFTYRSILPNQRSGRMLKKGDLLIEKSGGGEQQPVGAVVLFDCELDAVNSNFIARMPVRRGIDSNYLCYVHAALYAIRLNTRSIKQNTGIQNLNTTTYLNEEFALPPLLEQRAIASFLDRATGEIDRKILLLISKAEYYKQLKQSLISESVTHGLDKSTPMKDCGIEWLGKMPAHWNITAITNITKAVAIRNHPNEELLSVYRDYGVIIKSSRDDNHNRAGEDLASYKLVEPGFLVINKMKAWQGSLGVSSLRGIVSPAYITCKTNDRLVERRYLHYLLRCRSYINEYNRLSYGIRVDQWDMRYHDFKYIPVLLPPPLEQKAIASYIDEKTSQIDQIVAVIYITIEKLKELRKALINEVVTGKREVANHE